MRVQATGARVGPGSRSVDSGQLLSQGCGIATTHRRPSDFYSRVIFFFLSGIFAGKCPGNPATNCLLAALETRDGYSEGPVKQSIFIQDDDQRTVSGDDPLLLEALQGQGNPLTGGADHAS